MGSADHSSIDGSTRAGSLTGVLLISRVLGLCRDMVLAMLLGAGPASDALRAALKIPSMIRDLLAEGSISSAFIPAYEQQKVDRGDEAAHRFSRAVLTLLLIGTAGVAIALWFSAPFWMQWLAPGLENPALGVKLFIELLPFLLLVPLLAVLRGLLLASDRNRSAAASQAVQNAVLVAAGIVMWNTSVGAEEAASGWISAFLGGAVAALVLLAISGFKTHPMPVPTLRIRVAGIGRFSADLSIQLLAGSVVYLNSMIAIHFASSIGTGAITHLDNAFRFHFLPIALIGVALGTIAGVDASRLVARQQSRVLAMCIGRNLRNALFIAGPAAVGLSILAEPLIRLLLQHGKYSASDADGTIAVLRVFCLAIPLACLCPALIRTSMAMGHRWLLVCSSGVALTVNWTLLTTLEGRWGVPGLAFASVISTLASWAILEAGLRRRLALPRMRWRAVFGNTLVTLAVAASTFSVSLLCSLGISDSFTADLLTLLIGIPLGMVVTVRVGRQLCVSETKALVRLIRAASRVLRRS